MPSNLTRPYYRIIRPFSPGDAEDYVHTYENSWERDFPADVRYAPDRQQLWRAYTLIEKDLLRLFEYAEPTDENIKIYSHRTYELLLRAATEFETNCKRILESNGYRRRGNLNIKDYFKINRSSKLGEYAIFLISWSPKKKLVPFKEWKNKKEWTDHDCSLSWYQAYNDVKHDRHKEFPKASLENALCAIAALYIILFSQFAFATGVHSTMGDLVINFEEGTISTAGDIFEVVPPRWTEEELYNFDWYEIKNEPEPFARFPFK